jgi:hypothetical protein
LEFCRKEGINSKALVEVLMAFPDMVPLQINPSSVFFFCSWENFREAWRE